MGNSNITDALNTTPGIHFVGSPYDNCPANVDGGYRICFKSAVYPEVCNILFWAPQTNDLYFTHYDTRSMQPQDVVWKKVSATI